VSERTKSILVSLWLFICIPFNVATLRHLIRDVFELVAHLDAGLGRYLTVQYLLAVIFVVWVITLLLRHMKFGRRLAVVLLLGSCCEVVGLLFTAAVFAFQGTPHWPTLVGWVVLGVVLLVNIVCLGMFLRVTPGVSN